MHYSSAVYIHEGARQNLAYRYDMARFITVMTAGTFLNAEASAVCMCPWTVRQVYRPGFDFNTK